MSKDGVEEPSCPPARINVVETWFSCRDLAPMLLRDRFGEWETSFVDVMFSITTR